MVSLYVRAEVPALSQRQLRGLKRVAPRVFRYNDNPSRIPVYEKKTGFREFFCVKMTPFRIFQPEHRILSSCSANHQISVKKQLFCKIIRIP